AEIGYGLLQQFWGQGIISESVEKIVDFGINEMKLHRIYGYIDPENIASIKVVEKFNFVREGILKDDTFARSRYFDMCVYALINEKE
ncbi:MAG: GNAT family N-acetyltransferase, partial [Calditrichia bacterium]|nr:GNAT family N-acetyltransferase [Calditrichia bacterium]